jgi:DnaK suppressor protein
MTLTSEQTNELLKDLEDLARELQQSLEGSAQAARPVELDQPAVGRVSRIDAIQQQKMLEANRQAQKARLGLVRAALLRCEEDEYGDCRGCGESIGHKRLKARPESVFCIACQTARE